MKVHEGFSDIKVTLINWLGDDLAKHVYEFGRLSHDYDEVLPEVYNKDNCKCKMLIQKIIDGRTLPKYAMQGHRLDFRIEGISRICLAQLTRDQAIFASQGGGVHPLTQEFNLPLSIIRHKDVMDKVTQAQKLLEQAYVLLAEYEVPALEARYVGLHSQVISLTASYLPSDWVRSCWSRTNSNFCDECNMVYRRMIQQIMIAISKLTDENSIVLWNWLFKNKLINDQLYERESLYNSDFTYTNSLEAKRVRPAINDWRKSGWKMELERLCYMHEQYMLTDNEVSDIEAWIHDEVNGCELTTTYDNSQPDVLCNAIKMMDYYKEAKEALKCKTM